jgi:hypothetical protein
LDKFACSKNGKWRQKRQLFTIKIDDSARIREIRKLVEASNQLSRDRPRAVPARQSENDSGGRRPEADLYREADALHWRRDGATRFSALRRDGIVGVMAPLDRRRKGAMAREK